jgi:hypothetical protein
MFQIWIYRTKWDFRNELWRSMRPRSLSRQMWLRRYKQLLPKFVLTSELENKFCFQRRWNLSVLFSTALAIGNETCQIVKIIHHFVKDFSCYCYRKNHERPQVVSVVSRINPGSPSFQCFIIHFNIILLFMSSVLSNQCFWTKSCMRFLTLPCYVPHQSHPSWSDYHS